MGCSVPDKFERILKNTALIFVIMAGGAIFVAAMVFIFQKFKFVGDDATLGDVFTLASIIAAGLIATGGWLVVEWRERVERERLAKVDAIIFYRKMSDAARCGAALLLLLTVTQFGNLLKWLPSSFGSNKENLRVMYVQIQNLLRQVQQALPDVAHSFGDLKSLYAFNTEFGDHFMEVVLYIHELEIHLISFVEKDADERSKRFRTNPKGEERIFFEIVKCAADVCLSLEKCRRQLDGIKFSPEPSTHEFFGYGKRLQEISGRENPFNKTDDNIEVDADSYVRVFEITRDFSSDIVKGLKSNIYAD